MKKISILFVAFVLATTFVVPAIALDFVDVPENAWYYDNVKTAVESGLVNGKTNSTYCPEDNLTYAEAIKLAACMNQLHNSGKITLKSGTPWYQTYVDYCENNNIITKKYDYTALATRAGYMEIFANALPDEALKGINSVPDDSIPDVASSNEYAPSIYKLYRAGILQGSDAKHSCNPLSNIKRSEVAAILARMMDQTKRVRFGIDEVVTPSVPSDVITLGMLEDKGYKYQGYAGINSVYTFSYVTETRGYDVTVDIPENAKKAMDDLSIFDDDYDEKWASIRRSLVVADIKARNGEPLSESVLVKYIGLKASSLIGDGFNVRGYAGFGDVYVFYFEKDNQQYSVTLNDSVKDFMNEREFGDDSYETEILSYTIKEIKYDHPY